MIKKFDEAFSPEWIETNITNIILDLVILREIIPWQKIINRLSGFYSDRGPFGKSLRQMVALLIVMKYRHLSDRVVIDQVKENRYIQYFCNVEDKGLQTFLNPSSLCVFRKRLGEKGIAIIENEVFETLRRAGVIKGDNSLLDSTVLNNNIIYPNDVRLIFSAFKKMRQFAKLHKIPVWWDEDEIKRLWRGFGLNKGGDRAAYLMKFNILFIPALEVFTEKVNCLITSQKRKRKAEKMVSLLNLLEKQSIKKLNGEIHIKNRIVSLDEPEARPIVKGKIHPKCEFGTTLQMSFNREGFMITAENFIGSPNDKTLLPGTLDLFIKRMKTPPDTIVGDLGFRSRNNFKTASTKKIHTVFLAEAMMCLKTSGISAVKRVRRMRGSLRSQRICEGSDGAFTGAWRETGYGLFCVRPLII